MITLKDIFKAMCSHIKSVSDYPLVDSDLDEPIVRPSFKVFMDTVNTGIYSSGLRQVRVFFNVYFYAGNRKESKSEIMDTEDKILLSFLEPLEIKENCCVYVDDLEFEKVNDGVLNCSFDFEIGLEFINENDIQFMEELVVMENLKEEYENGD